MSAVKTSSDLPGLPSSQFVVLLDKIRVKLREVQSSAIWGENISKIHLKILIENLEKLEEHLQESQSFTGNTLARRSVLPLNSVIEVLIRDLKELGEKGNSAAAYTGWKVLFAECGSLTPAER